MSRDVTLHRRAAGQGHAGSAIELGYMMLNADHLGITRFASNISTAVKWFTVAASAAKDREGGRGARGPTHASSNTVEAHFMLGWAHHVGLPASERNATAAAWHYSRAVAAAGRWRGRAIAPRLGLALLSLDDWIIRWVPRCGTRPATRALERLQAVLLAARTRLQAAASTSTVPLVWLRPLSWSLARTSLRRTLDLNSLAHPTAHPLVTDLHFSLGSGSGGRGSLPQAALCSAESVALVLAVVALLAVLCRRHAVRHAAACANITVTTPSPATATINPVAQH
jgi:hypothetical protein